MKPTSVTGPQPQPLAQFREQGTARAAPLERIAELDRLARAAVDRFAAVIRGLSHAPPEEELFAGLIGLCYEFRAVTGFDAYLELDGAVGVRATLVVPRRWLLD